MEELLNPDHLQSEYIDDDDDFSLTSEKFFHGTPQSSAPGIGNVEKVTLRK